MALTLSERGVRRGDRVAILANVSWHWAAADMAILSLGALTVPIFHNSSPEDAAKIVENSRPKFIFVDGPKLRKKFESALAMSRGAEVAAFADWDSITSAVNPITANAFLEREISGRKVTDPATIIYTSGTTGEPKGIVLSHRQIMAEIETFKLVGMTANDRTLAFLPFAHVLGRIEIWGHCKIGYTMAFGEIPENVQENLATYRPTIISSVPRLFEKIFSTVEATAAENRAASLAFSTAVAVGEKYAAKKMNGESIPAWLRLAFAAADQAVFAKIRQALGGRLGLAICGGAALNPKLVYFFYACGLQILEGYGLSETTAAVTVNTREHFRVGSVGRPIGDTEIRIAEDGEILLRGSMVMESYYEDPASTEAAMAGGWFHTGDIGVIDGNGFLTITDRKKNLIKLSNGKFVAPAKIESLLQENRLISQAYVSGEGEKFLVALLTVDQKAAAAAGSAPAVKEEIRNYIAEINKKLPMFENIRRFDLLPQEFSTANEELTPSLKIKRKVIREKYAANISRLYHAE